VLSLRLHKHLEYTFWPVSRTGKCNKWRSQLILSYRPFATTVSQPKICDFQEKLLNVLKCCNFLWVQRRHNCCPAASYANCLMTLHLLKVHLQTFLSIPISQKCQIFSCDTLVANGRYFNFIPVVYYLANLLHSLVMAWT